MEGTDSGPSGEDFSAPPEAGAGDMTTQVTGAGAEPSFPRETTASDLVTQKKAEGAGFQFETTAADMTTQKTLHRAMKTGASEFLPETSASVKAPQKTIDYGYTPEVSAYDQSRKKKKS